MPSVWRAKRKSRRFSTSTDYRARRRRVERYSVPSRETAPGFGGSEPANHPSSSRFADMIDGLRARLAVESFHHYLPDYRAVVGLTSRPARRPISKQARPEQWQAPAGGAGAPQSIPLPPSALLRSPLRLRFVLPAARLDGPSPHVRCDGPLERLPCRPPDGRPLCHLAPRRHARLSIGQLSFGPSADSA